MRCLSILTFLVSAALINAAHAGIIVDNGIVQSFTPDEDPDSIGTLYFYPGSYDSLLANGTTPHLFNFSSSETDYHEEFVADLRDADNRNSLDRDIVYLFDLGDRPPGPAAPPRRNTELNYYVVVPFLSIAEWDGNLIFLNNNDVTLDVGDYPIYWASTTAPGTSPTVPEPSTAIVMGLLGIVGFAGNRRRRRRESVA